MDFPFESILGIPHLWKAQDSLMMFDVSVFFSDQQVLRFRPSPQLEHYAWGAETMGTTVR
jgi:hypothetical protein